MNLSINEKSWQFSYHGKGSDYAIQIRDPEQNLIFWVIEPENGDQNSKYRNVKLISEAPQMFSILEEIFSQYKLESQMNDAIKNVIKKIREI